MRVFEELLEEEFQATLSILAEGIRFNVEFCEETLFRKQWN